MATIQKPIVLDETLQELVSKQNEIKDILSNDSFEPPMLLNKNITVNGVYTPETGYDGFNQITVNVSGGGGVYQEKTVTSNGEVTPDPGYDALSKVTVNVSGGEALARSIADRSITQYYDNELTAVGYSAFETCQNLTVVILPACKILSDRAFMDCNALSIIGLNACEEVRSGAFGIMGGGAESLTRISLPACITIEGAFIGRSNLESVVLPVCTNIGSDTFEGCTGLREIKLDLVTAVTAIDENAFGWDAEAPIRPIDVYVPAALLSAFKADTNWANFESQGFVNIIAR